jgi:hypothetical protein
VKEKVAAARWQRRPAGKPPRRRSERDDDRCAEQVVLLVEAALVDVLEHRAVGAVERYSAFSVALWSSEYFRPKVRA